MTIYPPSIPELIQEQIDKLEADEWRQTPSRLPDKDVLRRIVDEAFHASLLTEERRRPGFRLMYCASEDFHSEDETPVFRPNRVIRLLTPIPFSSKELNRIAPAADLKRFLVCVCRNRESSSLDIWGLMDVGDNWWEFIHHETSGGTPPPNFLTIASTTPGELSFSIQGKILLVLNDGSISRPQNNPIWSGPISEFLAPHRQCLYEQTLQELKTDKLSEEGADEDYPQRFYNSFLERILYNIRYNGHGGTILIVPHEMSYDDPRLQDRILLKYATVFDYAWNYLLRSLVASSRYYDLYFPLTNGQNLTQERFREFSVLDHEREALDELIRDVSKSIASLASIDGAVVITTRFQVLGFGGEIVAASPTLDSVTVASEGKETIAIESFGTRHRSAFRFCSSFENSVAFIVSSDGGVKASKRQGRDLLFWPDINKGAMGL